MLFFCVKSFYIPVPSPYSHSWGKIDPYVFTKFNHDLWSSGLHAQHWVPPLYWFHFFCSPRPGPPPTGSMHTEGTPVWRKTCSILFLHIAKNSETPSLHLLVFILHQWAPLTLYVATLCLTFKPNHHTDVSTVPILQMKQPRQRGRVTCPILTSRHWKNKDSNMVVQALGPLC